MKEVKTLKYQNEWTIETTYVFDDDFLVEIRAVARRRNLKERTFFDELQVRDLNVA